MVCVPLLVVAFPPLVPPEVVPPGVPPEVPLLEVPVVPTPLVPPEVAPPGVPSQKSQLYVNGPLPLAVATNPTVFPAPGLRGFASIETEGLLPRITTVVVDRLTRVPFTTVPLLTCPPLQTLIATFHVPLLRRFPGRFAPTYVTV